MWHKIQTSITLATNFLFPTTCVSCKKIGDVLCEQCLSNVPVEHQRRGDVISVFSYQSPIIRRALWSLKYKNNKKIARVLAAILYDALLEDMSDQKNFIRTHSFLLIPLPLHKKRKRQRGYNQSELLCKELSLMDSLSFILKKDVLYRDRDTPSQTTLRNKKERFKNVHNCFSVKNPREVRGKHIILVDDITTTGATLNEAIKTLRKAGAKKVVAYTVAH